MAGLWRLPPRQRAVHLQRTRLGLAGLQTVRTGLDSSSNLVYHLECKGKEFMGKRALENASTATIADQQCIAFNQLRACGQQIASLPASACSELLLRSPSAAGG